MKYLYWVLVLCLIGGCKKEQHQCRYNIYYLRNSYVAFKGFSAEELDTVVVERYKANCYPEGKISSDTLLVTAYFADGVAYTAPGADIDPGFIKVDTGIDIRIILPGTKEFMITGVSTGPPSYSWEQKEECGLGAAEARINPFENIHVNSKLVYSAMSPQNSSYCFIYLEK